MYTQINTAFTAMPKSLNSSAIPSTHIDMPYFAMEYATWFPNQKGVIQFNGGEMLRIWPLEDFFRCGSAYFEAIKVPLVFI